MLWWLSGLGAAVVVGLVVTVVVWVVRGHRRARRQAKLLAQLAQQYRKARPALPVARESPALREEPPRRAVTVDELVSRIESEGLPVRLQWDEGQDGSDEDDWPTGVLPRVE